MELFVKPNNSGSQLSYIIGNIFTPNPYVYKYYGCFHYSEHSLWEYPLLFVYLLTWEHRLEKEPLGAQNCLSFLTGFLVLAEKRWASIFFFFTFILLPINRELLPSCSQGSSILLGWFFQEDLALVSQSLEGHSSKNELPRTNSLMVLLQATRKHFYLITFSPPENVSLSKEDVITHIFAFLEWSCHCSRCYGWQHKEKNSSIFAGRARQQSEWSNPIT